MRFNFIQHIELHRTQILADFTVMFQDSLTDHSREHLHGFVYGAADGKQSLIYRIIERLNSIHKERANLRKRVQKLNQLIKKKEGNPIKDQNYEMEMDEQIFVAKGWQTVALDDVIAELSLCLRYCLERKRGLSFPPPLSRGLIPAGIRFLKGEHDGLAKTKTYRRHI